MWCGVMVYRHGQSEYNRNGRIGGDSGLSEHGVAYAKALAKFVHEKVGRLSVCLSVEEVCELASVLHHHSQHHHYSLFIIHYSLFQCYDYCY